MFGIDAKIKTALQEPPEKNDSFVDVICVKCLINLVPDDIF